MRDLKQLLEPLSEQEMPDRWPEIRRREPAPMPEPRRSRVVAYALSLAIAALVVLIVARLTPLGTQGSFPGAETAPEPPAWLVKQAYELAYASGDITPTSAEWVLSDANAIAPAVGLESGDPTIQEYLVVLHGDFTAYWAKVPTGAALPTGSVLTFAVPADSRDLTDVSVGDRDVSVPGLQPFTLPDPSQTFTDVNGWTVAVPPGWQTFDVLTNWSGHGLEGGQISNGEPHGPIAAPDSLPQVSAEGFPSHGVALVITPTDHPPRGEERVWNPPLSIDNFTKASAPAGDSTLDVLWFGGPDGLFVATLRMGRDASAVDVAAVAAVVGSLAFTTRPS